MAKKVEIELDTLHSWFRKLENGDSEEVTELIYDKIQELEKQVKDEEYGRVKKREEILAQIEPSLMMKQVVIDGLYRIKKQWNFKPHYVDLKGAEILILAKARTKVTIRVVEPGNQFEGQTFKLDLQAITHK